MLKSAITLALDTSSSFCSIAIRKADGTILSDRSNGDGDHFEQLPNLVDRVCEKGSIKRSEISNILIGTGPGSFTGIRIGMSFAKGLAWTLRIPIIGCSSFLGCMLRVLDQVAQGGVVGVVADARRSEIFIAKYSKGIDGAFNVVLDPCITPINELKTHTDVSYWCTPEKSFKGEGVTLVPVPDIATGFLEVKLVNKEFSIPDISYIEPTYLRAVSAKTIAERKGA